jgi:urease accessory protein
MTTEQAGLYRLLAWLSPSFPTGAFSYSHGLEAAVAGGAIHDRAGLEGWVAAIVAHGSGRVDADILRDAYAAARAGDHSALSEVNRRGLAYRATAELALESAQQGAAFLAAHRAAWAVPLPGPVAASREREGPAPQAWEGEGPREVCHAAAFGAAAAEAGIALEDALLGYLLAFAGNLVSAGLRLGVIGQTDGQRILAALEPVVAAATQAALARDPRDFGTATFALDLASMAHETQYSRLFRS